jgi:hypothetical protein
MKNFIFTLLVLISAITFSQNKNFDVENGLIKWRCVFEDSTSILELNRNPSLEFLTDSTGFIKINVIDIDDGKILFVQTGEFKIESKKRNYNVTVWNFKSYYPINFIYVKGLRSMKEFPIEKYYLNKHGDFIRTLWTNGPSKKMDRQLIELFTIKKQLDLSDKNSKGAP